VDPPTNVEKILHLHTQEDGYALGGSTEPPPSARAA